MDEQNQTSNALEPVEENPKHSGGRPSSIDNIVVAKLIGAFQQGLSVKNACGYAGISTDAYYRRLNSDEQFRSEIEQSKLFLSLHASDIVLKAMLDPNTPQATRVKTAMWYLERKNPEEFGRNPKREEIPAAEPNLASQSMEGYYKAVPMKLPDLVPYPMPDLKPFPQPELPEVKL